jgi:hypothetical protein
LAWNYIPIPSISLAALSFSSGLSTTIASVVANNPAIEATSCRRTVVAYKLL